MSSLWKECVKHNQKLKSKKGTEKKSDESCVKSDVKGDIKAKNVLIALPGVTKLLSEASSAVEGISEKVDLSGLYFHGNYESTCKVKAALLLDSDAARTTLPSTSGLTNVQLLDNDIKLEFAIGDKGSTIVEEGSLFLNGRNYVR